MWDSKTSWAAAAAKLGDLVCRRLGLCGSGSQTGIDNAEAPACQVSTDSYGNLVRQRV
mgnify:CR=1 FL=1